MRRIVGAVLTAMVLVGCEGGGVSADRLQSMLDRSDAMLSQASRAVSVAEEAVEAAKAMGAGGEVVARLQDSVADATAIAADLKGTNDRLRSDLDAARQRGESSVPWDQILTGLITGGLTLVTGQKIRNDARRRRGEQI